MVIGSSTYPIRAASAVSFSSSASQGLQRAGPAGDGDGGSRISHGAKLLGKLQQLQSEDPAKFKQLMSEAATQLQKAASNASGPEAEKLTDLASRFEKAAGGDLSALQPPARSSRGSNPARAAYQQNSGPPPQDFLGQVMSKLTPVLASVGSSLLSKAITGGVL